MLQNILQEIEKSQGIISLAALSDRLDIQKSALRGILQFWASKGKIQIIHDPLEDQTLLCLSTACDQKKCTSCALASKKKLVF